MQIRDLLRTAALATAACSGLIACGSGCGGQRGVSHPPGDADGDATGGGSDAMTDDGSNPNDGSMPPPIDARPATGPLRVGKNPRYFVDAAGTPVYLTGSHTWSNFKDRAVSDPPPAFNYGAYLDFLVARHHNFIRLWTWEQPHSADNVLLFFTPFPWKRTGPGLANDGKPRFDLDMLDPAYTDRLRQRVIAARDRGIYVAVMLFDGWDLVNFNATDGGFPFADGNNINGVKATGAQAIMFPNPILARQEAYVRAVIDAVNDLDNVLYEIANETDQSGLDWQKHMIDFVKSVEAGKPKQHPVGMTSIYPSGRDSDLLASNADWISPNGQIVESDGTKVILNDTDHSYGWSDLKRDGPEVQRAWAWKVMCAGTSPVFMDPYLETWQDRNAPSGGRLDSYWDTIRDALGRTRLYAERLDLERAVPSGALSTTGCCLADPGHQYLVYKPMGATTFKLTMLAGTYRFEWYNPASGAVSTTGMITVGAEDRTFMPPFPGDAVLLLTQ